VGGYSFSQIVGQKPQNMDRRVEYRELSSKAVKIMNKRTGVVCASIAFVVAALSKVVAILSRKQPPRFLRKQQLTPKQ